MAGDKIDFPTNLDAYDTVTCVRKVYARGGLVRKWSGDRKSGHKYQNCAWLCLISKLVLRDCDSQGDFEHRLIVTLQLFGENLCVPQPSMSLASSSFELVEVVDRRSSVGSNCSRRSYYSGQKIVWRCRKVLEKNISFAWETYRIIIYSMSSLIWFVLTGPSCRLFDICQPGSRNSTWLLRSLLILADYTKFATPVQR